MNLVGFYYKNSTKCVYNYQDYVYNLSINSNFKYNDNYNYKQ